MTGWQCLRRELFRINLEALTVEFFIKYLRCPASFSTVFIGMLRNLEFFVHCQICQICQICIILIDTKHLVSSKHLPAEKRLLSTLYLLTAKMTEND